MFVGGDEDATIVKGKAMRMRLISAAIVLGLGTVGITLAQQTSKEPKWQANAKANLRAQVVKLRVEVELLELDHDADRAHLLDMMKGMREYETKSPEEIRQAVEMSMYFSRQERGKSRNADEIIKKKVDAARALIDRKKQDYAKQAAELAEKRLKLVDVEKRYNRGDVEGHEGVEGR